MRKLIAMSILLFIGYHGNAYAYMTEWGPKSLRFSVLVSQGYEVKSHTIVIVPREFYFGRIGRLDSYILQKGASVAKCEEISEYGTSINISRGIWREEGESLSRGFICFHLVDPHQED